MAGICGRRWFMRSMNISLRYMARSGAFPVAAVGGLVPAPLDRHNRLAARIQHGRYHGPQILWITMLKTRRQASDVRLISDPLYWLLKT